MIACIVQQYLTPIPHWKIIVNNVTCHVACTVRGHKSPTGKRVFEINNTNASNCPMPTQRKAKHHELNPVERAYLIGRHDAGESFDKISHETGVPKTTIVDTFQNAENRGSTISLPRACSRKTDL